MSISSEITRIKTNIANAYNKAEEKGATLPKVLNSENLASAIDSIDMGEWRPQPDWWNIQKIVEEDTEDYPAKIGLLFTDYFLTQQFTHNQFYNADKIVFSDGQVASGIGLYTIAENGLKECSKGYKTYYAIIYLKTTNFKLDYTNIQNEFNGLKMMYFYNVEEMNVNTTFNINNCYFLEAWLSNKPFVFRTNGGFQINNAFMLQKLPEISLYNRGTGAFDHCVLLNINGAPLLKKSELLKAVGNWSAENNGTYLNNCINTFWNETLDFENDFGIDTSKLVRYYTIQGPYEIETLDFNSATSLSNEGCGVKRINNVRNIKVSNSYFKAVNGSSFPSKLEHDTLIRILEALYDYSNDTENTYTLTLGLVNLAKLTDEELAIGQNKGWTIS